MYDSSSQLIYDLLMLHDSFIMTHLWLSMNSSKFILELNAQNSSSNGYIKINNRIIVRKEIVYLK